MNGSDATDKQTRWRALLIDGADQEQAEILQIGFGAPVATMHRSIKDSSGTAIYVADVVYRGDVVRLDIDLPQAPLRKEHRRTDYERF